MLSEVTHCTATLSAEGRQDVHTCRMFGIRGAIDWNDDQEEKVSSPDEALSALQSLAWWSEEVDPILLADFTTQPWSFSPVEN